MERQLNLTVTLKDGVTRPSFAGLQPLIDYLWACKQDTPLGAPNQDGSAWLDNDNPGRLYITLPDNATPNPAYNWKIGIKGLGTISFRSNLFPVGSHENGVQEFYTDPKNLILEPSVNFFKPTREQACKIGITAQGLLINVPGYGILPWFEPAYNAWDDSQRASIRQQKLAAGDTHAIIWAELTEPSDVFGEGSIYESIIVQPYDTVDRVVELLQDGLIPVLVLDGDGPTGYEIAIPQLMRVCRQLQHNKYNIDLRDYVVFMTNWDGVFYGWEPSNIVFREFGSVFRAVNPNGYLFLEFNTGHLPVGGGPGDYGPGNNLQDWDGFLWEGNDPDIHDDATWQVLQRLLGPTYIKPADDPNSPGPWYPAPGTIRGPYYIISFEYRIREWVFTYPGPYDAELALIANDRAYLRALSNASIYNVS